MTENIPYSLRLRIVRICSLIEDREKRFLELKTLLLSRDYKPKMIDSAIERARNVPRSQALKNNKKACICHSVLPQITIYIGNCKKILEDHDTGPKT